MTSEPTLARILGIAVLKGIAVCVLFSLALVAFVALVGHSG